jgi:gliding motility-associated-like protein
MITVSDEGMYSLIVTDLNNCNTSATASLKQCRSEIYFPTAFTPDFNGFNDTFKPVLGSNTLISYSISIYNKWGQLVYQSSDPVMGWDGRFKNEDCPTGIYNYVVRFQVFADVNQPKPEKLVRGSLTLVR